ncbi:MAG TPA: PRC-barrel domain-containing protein [Gemmataceae bacterium]|nr:PRC-barrel domain-containing protein [Gemmataceae bacterium]
MNRMHRMFVLTAGVALAALAVAAADEAAKSQIPAGVFRASALEGIAVRNAKNENLGKLEDLVVNKDGKIVYGVLSHGGVAGIGDKLFAVPPSQLVLTDMPNNRDKKEFLVSVDKSVLDGNPGFNEKDLPTAPSSVFTAGGSSRDAGAGHASKELLRVRKVIGMNVKNTSGEDLGKVDDVMVSLKDAKIVYAWLSHGSRLTGSAKYFAVPWDAMEMKSLTGKPTDVNFVLDVTKATLDSAAGHAKDPFPSEPDRQMFKRK